MSGLYPLRIRCASTYGYFDLDLLRSDVEAAGLSADIEEVSGTNRGTAEEIAGAF